jgi:hypothetical protein
MKGKDRKQSKQSDNFNDLQTEVLDSFTDLQTEVLRSLESQANKVRGELLSISFFKDVYPKITSAILLILFLTNIPLFDLSFWEFIFIVIFVFFFSTLLLSSYNTLAQKITLLKQEALRSILNFVLHWSLYLMFLPSAFFLILNMGRQWIDIRCRFPMDKYPLDNRFLFELLSAIANFQSCPAGPISADQITKITDILDISVFSEFRFFWIQISVATAIVLLLLSMIIYLIPNFVFLLISSPIFSPTKASSKYLLSHDKITINTSEKSLYVSRKWSKEITENIFKIIESKAVNIEAQTQSISSYLTGLTLLSLSAIFLTQEQTQGIFFKLTSYFVSKTSPGQGEALKNYALFYVIISITTAAWFFCSYFIRGYWSLRALEIMKMVCNLRLMELDQDKRRGKLVKRVAHYDSKLQKKQTFWSKLFKCF